MSWKGFMNKLVVGKKKDKDFNRSNLPTNRKQVFKFAYKQQWLTLFNINFLVALFALPFILFEILYFIYGFSANNQGVAKQNSIAMSCFLIRFPTMLLASVGLAGAVYAIRKICWDEPLTLKKDFFKGIKNSGKLFMGISAIISVFMLVSELLINYYSEDTNFLTVYIIFSVYLISVIILIVAIYHFAICSLYNMGFLSSLKLAIFLSFKKLFFNILMLIVGVLPVAIFFLIPITTFYFIGITILFFGGLSYLILVCFLFTNATFDKYINEKEYPEFVRKGMYVYKEEDQKHTEQDIKSLAELLASDVDDTSAWQNTDNVSETADKNVLTENSNEHSINTSDGEGEE